MTEGCSVLTGEAALLPLGDFGGDDGFIGDLDADLGRSDVGDFAADLTGDLERADVGDADLTGDLLVGEVILSE